MQITVERVTKEGAFHDEQGMLLLARFTIHDADPSSRVARLAIAAEVRAMTNLNRTLLDATPTTGAAEGKPDDVWVTIPIPRTVAEDSDFDLAAELAPEVAEAYVYTLADRARSRP